LALLVARQQMRWTAGAVMPLAHATRSAVG
jgi:hypothetical protein